MSGKIRDAEKLTPTFNYPFASAPDIIRAHQKDVYSQEILFNYMSSLIRRFKGAYVLHTYVSQVKAFSEMLYLGLTTLIGNQTLGEEYCNIVQIEDDSLKLPAFKRRVGYVLSSTVLQYILTKTLRILCPKLRAKLESKLCQLNDNKKNGTKYHKIISYVLENLSTITSPTPIQTITLIIFYFSGAYYELSKKIWGLRYIFTKRIPPSEARVGYEVLGVLLLLRMSTQIWFQLHTIFRIFSENSSPDSNVIESQNSTSKLKTTFAEVIAKPKYDLSVASLMPWIKGQNRKCTLCLEEMKDPSAAVCGHLFCWVCICDWIREKQECPLCRRRLLMQNVLPLITR